MLSKRWPHSRMGRSLLPRKHCLSPNAFTDLATRHKIPTTYEFREFVEAGGLISYAH